MASIVFGSRRTNDATVVDLAGSCASGRMRAGDAGSATGDIVTEYLITIYNDPTALPPTGTVDPSHQEFMVKHGSALRGGAALEGHETATTIRDGVMTDGLF